MEKVIFITNELFINEEKPEGGVRLCTYDFIKLLQCRFEVIIFPIKFNRSIIFRLKAKIGIDVFEDYKKEDYKEQLFECVNRSDVSKIFINLASTSDVSKTLKEKFGDSIKVILCSHGNESGDFLHQSVRFKEFMPWLKRLTSSWRLGKVLQSELRYRINFFDLVLTVSEIEDNIEQWLGAKKTFFVPRVFSEDYVEWNPVIGRIGIIADVSHFPNYYGLSLLCEEIIQSKPLENLQLRVVGKSGERLNELLKKYTFLISMEYLDGGALKDEVSTWMYFLNPVFYYSKGVSTKLAKGMNWGLPVLSTIAGNRGYVFKKGGPVTCDDVKQMAYLIKTHCLSMEDALEDRKKVKLAVESFDDFNIVMDDLYPVFSQL